MEEPYETDPDEDDSGECECINVARPLLDPPLFGVRLVDLDHVCEDSMRLSCVQWAFEQILRSAHPDPQKMSLALGDGRYTEAVHWGAGEYLQEETVEYLDEETGETSEETVWEFHIDPDEDFWPVPLQESEHQLMLVLRQWIEDPPDADLIPMLTKLPAWKRAQEAVLACVDDAGDGTGSRYLPAPVEPQWILARQGLPATLATSRFLLQSIGLSGGTKVVGPSRGVSVTSFALAPKDPTGPNECEIVSTIASVSPWSNSGLMRQAEKVTGEHAAWWGKLPFVRMPQVDRRKERGPKFDEFTDLVEQRAAGTINASIFRGDAIKVEQQRAGATLTQRHIDKLMRRLNARVERLKNSSR